MPRLTTWIQEASGKQQPCSACSAKGKEELSYGEKVPSEQLLFQQCHRFPRALLIQVRKSLWHKRPGALSWNCCLGTTEDGSQLKNHDANAKSTSPFREKCGERACGRLCYCPDARCPSLREGYTFLPRQAEPCNLVWPRENDPSPRQDRSLESRHALYRCLFFFRPWVEQ